MSVSDFPYTPSPANVVAFLGTIHGVNVPSKVDRKYLESLGFNSSNDRYLVRVLKFLGFIDTMGVPVERWTLFRDKQRAPFELAAAIREGYSGLFATYSDANRKDDEALTNFFRSNSRVSESTVLLMVRTFKGLCGMADFGLGVHVAATKPAGKASELAPVSRTDVQDARSGEVPARRLDISSQGITVNVNIQLALPADKEGSVYDKLFESLKKHLLT